MINRVPFRAPDRPSYEHNDCTVCAVAAAYDVPYATAHALLAEQAARRPRHGTKASAFRRMLSVTPIFGCRTELLNPGYRPTLAHVIAGHRQGRYIALTHNHALAIVDGKTIDLANTGARARICGLWRIEKPAPAVPAPVPTPVIPAVVSIPANLPFAVTRYLQLRSAGQLADAVKLFNAVTPKIQALILQEVK